MTLTLSFGMVLIIVLLASLVLLLAYWLNRPSEVAAGAESAHHPPHPPEPAPVSSPVVPPTPAVEPTPPPSPPAATVAQAQPVAPTPVVREAPAVELEAPEAIDEEPVAVTVAPEKPAPTQPDDLTRVEGIGPKIAGLLDAAGISTFAQLASTDAKQLKDILERAGSRYRLADPSTWSEQARLAAAGEWEALVAFQERLKGGRRT